MPSRPFSHRTISCGVTPNICNNATASHRKTFYLFFSATSWTFVQHLGATFRYRPTTMASFQFFTNISRLATFCLNHSASCQTQCYQLCSIGFLPQDIIFHRRLSALRLLRFGALPISTSTVDDTRHLFLTDLNVGIWAYSSFASIWPNLLKESTVCTPPMPFINIWRRAYICVLACRIHSDPDHVVSFSSGTITWNVLSMTLNCTNGSFLRTTLICLHETSSTRPQIACMDLPWHDDKLHTRIATSTLQGPCTTFEIKIGEPTISDLYTVQRSLNSRKFFLRYSLVPNYYSSRTVCNLMHLSLQLVFIHRGVVLSSHFTFFLFSRRPIYITNATQFRYADISTIKKKGTQLLKVNGVYSDSTTIS